MSRKPTAMKPRKVWACVDRRGRVYDIGFTREEADMRQFGETGDRLERVELKRIRAGGKGKRK